MSPKGIARDLETHRTVLKKTFVIWLQSIICSSIFIANFAFQPKPVWLAVTLNLLLAVSCLGLLITTSRWERADQIASSPPGQNGNRGRNVIVIALALLCVALSVARLNGTSTAAWLGMDEKSDRARGLIAGTPKGIRADEWLVQTPWTWSQARQDPPFPASNRNVGNGSAPLVTNLPAWHWSTFFRPQMWGFFFLSTESAFALNWNLKWFAMLLSGFLFLRIVARGSNFLALSGSLILLFASYLQWWFSTPTCMPEMISMVFFGLWALHLMFQAKSRWVIVGAGTVLLIALVQFVFCSYPRFQIPLAYFAAALLVGGWASHRNRTGETRETPGYFPAVYLALILMIATTVVWRWFQEVSPAIQEISTLSYPGQVVSSGGSFPWSGFLAPFLEFGMTEDHYPKPLGNVCEASGFILLAPFLAAALIRDVWQRRRDGLFAALVVFLSLVMSFIVCGVPMWLARLTGWSYVASGRAVLVVGVASVVALVRYLSDPRPGSECRTSTLLVGAAALASTLFACLYLANLRLANFAGLAEVTAAAVFFALVFCLLWQRARTAACLLLLGPSLYANGLVNPIGRGVPGLAHNSALHRMAKIHQEDPQALWLVAADSLSSQSLYIAQFVKASGATVLGGVRCMPDREMIRVLDPENKYATVYNRYAGVYFVATPDGSPVFELLAPGHYRVRLPMQPQMLERLGVKYLVLADGAAGMSVPGFEAIGREKDLVILRRR
jgi:hypothetical protein